MFSSSQRMWGTLPLEGLPGDFSGYSGLSGDILTCAGGRENFSRFDITGGGATSFFLAGGGLLSVEWYEPISDEFLC